MPWNYRVATYISSFEKHLGSNPNTRLFSVIEVHYDSDEDAKIGKGASYLHSNPVANWESLEDLKKTLKLLQEAFKRPVIDLDNFPNEWIKPKLTPEEEAENEKRITELIIKTTKCF